MKKLFCCPSCSEKFNANDLIKDNSSLSQSGLCPNCKVKLQITNFLPFVIALIITVLATIGPFFYFSYERCAYLMFLAYIFIFPSLVKRIIKIKIVG